MQCKDLNVAVVGGATGGALAALFLARAGARVTLFERVATPRALGAGIAIAENGLAVLDALELGAAMRRLARQVGPARIADANGRTLLAPQSDGVTIWMMRRSDLQGLLLEAITAESGITPLFGREVVSASGDGSVRMRDGEGEREFRFDLVVAADGAHSRIRESGNFNARVQSSGIAYLRALIDEDLAREEEAWTSAGLFGSFALPRGTYVYASAGSAECRAAIAAKDLEGLRRAWAKAYPPADAILGPLRRWDELIINHVIRVQCERWHDGRLVLLGDAAHAMAPNLGQGANSAMVDAAILRLALENAPSIESALSSYAARRKPAVTKVGLTAARLGALAEATHPVARWTRDRLLLPILSRMPAPMAMVLQEPPEALRAIGTRMEKTPQLPV